MKTNNNFDNLTKEYSLGRLNSVKYNAEGKPVLRYPARPRKFRPNRMSTQDVVKERLKLQSTIRAIESEFGIENPTFEKLTSLPMVYTYKSWPREKQSHYLEILGGFANKGQTAQMLQNFYNEYEKDIPF